MSSSNTSLVPLLSKRVKWVKANRENGFEDGIKKLLSDLYPDQAHFIYELLQNAEDAKASVVKFDLQDEQLVVSHDGKRLFTYKDVESITSIGDSTKSDDVNQIGKFGVGFKAVFAYTDTPQIHSGGYHFEIRDLVCPFDIAPRKKKVNETIFVFPFNNEEKDAETCCKEVRHVFRHLNHSVLLFLKHIEAIEWTIKGSSPGMILRAQREDISPDLFQISIINPAQANRQKESWYLRYERILSGHGDLQCGIALKLAFKDSDQKEPLSSMTISEQMKIVPDHGRLCIFFPTEKENTRLKFHLNGPYSSTIDRASIRHDDKENISIMDITSELWSDVLEIIKGNGFLTADFLSILPNDDDDLSSFYSSIRDATYNSLKTRELLPTQNGFFADSGDLVRGPKLLTDLLSDDDLSFLSGREGRKWVVNVMRHQRADKLLQSVGIPEWGNEELLEAIEEHFSSWADEEDKKVSCRWLLDKDIEWARDLYLALWGAAKKEAHHFYNLDVVLTEDNDLVDANDVYFPPEENISHLGLKLVKRSLFEKIKFERRERLKQFFTAIGVKEIGEEEELKNIIAGYYSEESKPPSQKQHRKHMQRFIQWAKLNESFEMFRWKCIFFDRDKQLRSADECYLDSPLVQTGMVAVRELTATVPLWKGYNKIKGFVDFAKKVGVLFELKIERKSISNQHPQKDILHKDYWQRHTHTAINQDYQIEDLEKLIGAKDQNISYLVWSTMCKAPKVVLDARFRPNQQYQTMIASSTLVHCLSKASWIPAKDGNFYPPQEITKNNLLDNWIYDDRNGWLTAIEFGKEAAQATEEFKAKQRNAKDLGIEIEDAEFIKNNHEEFLKWKNEQKSKREASSFPDKPSKSPTRRKKKIAKKLKDAPKKKYGQKTRTVRESRNLVDPSPWLITQYTNDDGHMFCQLCQQELSVASFKKRDGKEYFECIEIFNKDRLDIEHESQFLALCPLCAAKYKEFIKRDADSSEWLLEQLMDENNFEISLKLGEELVVLRFVETHYHDLHVVLWGAEDDE